MFPSKASLDPVSWAVQLVALLLVEWKASGWRVRRKHEAAVRRLVSKAVAEAEIRAVGTARSVGAVGGMRPSDFGGVLLDGDEDALRALKRVAVDASCMPRHRRWWPTSVDVRLAGMDSSEAARGRVWLDELPEALRRRIQDELGKPESPLADLPAVTHVRDALTQAGPSGLWPSLRDRRRLLDAYLIELLKRAVASPVHGGHGVARVGQPVRVRRQAGDLDEVSELGPGREGEADPYLPKGAEAHAKNAPPRLWSEGRQDWRLVSVLGEPGYGKSWLLSEEALHAAEAARRQRGAGVEPDELAVPVWVRLDAVAARSDGSRGVEAAVVAALADSYELTDGLQLWMVDMLTADASPWLVLLDGLDEVPEQDRDRLLRKLRNWIPKCRVVLTSRRVGFPTTGISQHHGWGQVELVPFGEQEIKGFVAQWFGLPDADAAALAESLVSQKWLAGLVRVPLLLSLVCLLLSRHEQRTAPPAPLEAAQLRQRVAELPHHRAGLYLRMVRLFVRQGHRGALALDDTGVDVRIRQASKIAWAFSTTHAGWAERLTAPQIRYAADLTQAETDKAVRSLQDQGLLVIDGSSQGLSSYRFLHRTFHEYLTAQYLANLPGDGWQDEVEERMWFDPDWQQVIQLLAGVLDDRGRILDMLASQESRPPDIEG